MEKKKTMDKEESRETIRRLESRETSVDGVLRTVEANIPQDFSDFMILSEDGFEWWPSEFKQTVRLTEMNSVPFWGIEVVTDFAKDIDSETFLQLLEHYLNLPMMPAVRFDAKDSRIELANIVPLLSYGFGQVASDTTIVNMVLESMSQQVIVARHWRDQIGSVIGPERLNTSRHPANGVPRWPFTRGVSHGDGWSSDWLGSLSEFADSFKVRLDGKTEDSVDYVISPDEGIGPFGQIKFDFVHPLFGRGMLKAEFVPMDRFLLTTGTEMVKTLHSDHKGSAPHLACGYDGTCGLYGNYAHTGYELAHSVFISNNAFSDWTDGCLSLLLLSSVRRAKALDFWMKQQVILIDDEARKTDEEVAAYHVPIAGFQEKPEDYLSDTDDE